LDYGRGALVADFDAPIATAVSLCFVRFTILTALFVCAVSAQSLPQILNEELQRNFTVLKQKADPPPYFMGYEVTEQESLIISAAMGSIISNSKSHARYLDITVRVGTPQLDNYHAVGGQRARFTPGTSIPLDNVPNAIRRTVWLATDRTYRAAARRLIEIKSNAQTRLGNNDKSDDFSTEKPSVHEEETPRVKFSEEEWLPRLRKWSAELAKYDAVLSSGVSLIVNRETKYIVNTEGSRLQFGRSFTTLMLNARGKAPDGMDLLAAQDFQASEPAHLPDSDKIQAAVKKVGNDLIALLQAPMVEPFVGPAILSGSASGVFFHDIFGHRVEGHRQKDEAEGQTFTKSLNAAVLPGFLSVVFDATKKTLGSVDLNGWYEYDDEGVAARPVVLVENGILKTFLMSRAPIQGFASSNGHGRRQPGHEIVSRQSNLIVESKKQVSDVKLREMLVDEVKRQNKPYGLYFEQVTGGFTTTQRRGLQAFTVVPLMVYRVYPDGRPDELVRGVDIVGTPLASFAKILATSDKPEVFNGYCGAESGNVPVSATSPALLVSEIEIQKKDRGQETPPVLPRPTDGGGQ
jgi:TldD protein